MYPFQRIAALIVLFGSIFAAGKLRAQAVPPAYPLTTKVNFVRTWDAQVPTQNAAAITYLTPIDSFIMTTQFMDGLGKSLQTVTKQLSPGRKDHVQPFVYDIMGRERYKYLPFIANSTGGNTFISDGQLKFNPFQQDSVFNKDQYPGETYFYGEQQMEISPLERIAKTYAVGNSWASASGNKPAELQYMTNTAADSVRIWTIAAAAGSIPVSVARYGTGQLFKNISIDENGNKIIEYKDKNDRTILKKTQLVAAPGTDHTGWANTYYVYDDLDNLRFVITPKAVGWLMINSWNFSSGGGSSVVNELCFRYEYDGRNRMYIKKVPGAGEVRMVYDVRDRLVMSQDSVLRSQQKWLVSCYDVLNRVDTVALMTDPVHYNDRAWHQNLANTTAYPYYPNTSGYVTELQVATYYDNYSWLTPFGTSLSASMTTTYNNDPTYFLTTYNTSPSYAVPMNAYAISRGQMTGTRSRVIGTTQYLYNIPFYDDHGRVIQNESNNYTNATDLETSQYSFSSKLLRKMVYHRKNGNLPQGHILLTKYAYDAAGRMISLRKITDGTGDKRIDSLLYDEMGQVRAKYLGNNLDSLVYDYNVRGWTIGINRKYLTGASNNYFGMELGFGSLSSFTGLTTFPNLQFNGNIAGVIWKGAGDNVLRKYDFSYDYMSRLTSANNTQSTVSAFTKPALTDFSVRVDSYDANGNIMKMNQNGYKTGSSGAIDSLVYNYGNSNKLLGVTDLANDVNSRLGDFHYDPVTKGATDYTYDGNGNLTADKNKGITSTQYNFLNLPQVISFTKADGTSKGNIQYKYDGQGNKLLKTITDSTVTPVKITNILYAAGFQYENDSARFWGHEEGRTRYFVKHYMNGDSSFKILNDYFETDQLGNTRAILTEDRDTSRYIATMEGAYRAKERAIFYNIDETAYPRASVAGYPADLSVTNPNDSVSRLDGTTKTMGPGILLKVMRGDSILIGVKGFYKSTGSTAGGTSDAFNAILSSLASGLAGMTGAAHGGSLQLSGSGNPVYGALNTFRIGNNATPPSTPKAYLNWMLLDNQFQYVSTNGQSGSQAFTTADVLDSKAKPLGLKNSGYLYVWVSNETKGWEVYFDNLSVTHFAGPLVEETHYYPFGLTMQAISDKALKFNYTENKYRYNKGSELQNKEFADGSGLEMYETHLRELDPQLGRWWQLDSKPDYAQSLYASMDNNPVLKNDPMGDEACCKVLWDAIKSYLQAREEVGQLINDHVLKGKGTDFALEALNVAGTTMNGYLHVKTYGAWPTNPAEALGFPTVISPMASNIGQLAATAPIGPGGISPDANLVPAGNSPALTFNFRIQVPSFLTNFVYSSDNSQAAESGDKTNTLQPGPNANESIPARSSKKTFNTAERTVGNMIGYARGCHTCGAPVPGTKSGNWVLDHQPVSSLNFDGVQQYLYPQCLNCSLTQGGQALQEMAKKAANIKK